jgi:4-amino-4-deoxy-L-arabinose transferase-like glycosyltransferase
MRSYAIVAILALALACRLYHIMFPIEGWHAWRQADTAAIARNFYDHGFDFFHPQVNHGGDTPGYVDTEFPLYPFFVALLWKLFGVHDGWGRSVSVLSSLGTIYVLYLFTKKYLGVRVALWAALFYSILPLNIYYARTFMPHALVLFCTMIGLYFFSEWLETRTKRAWILSALGTTLAVLMNPTTLVIGFPLAYLSSRTLGKAWLRSGVLWWYAVSAIVPAVCWYVYSYLALYSPQFSIGISTFGTDKWGNGDLLLTLKFYNDVFMKNIAERHLTYAATIPFVVGLFLKREHRNESVFDWWLIAVIVYFLIVAKGNDVHEYYQLPFILPAVVFIGKTFERYIVPLRFTSTSKGKLLGFFFVLCLIGTILLSFLRYSESFAAREEPNSAYTRLANAVSTITQPNDLLITLSEGDPILLYRSHRKGWVARPGVLDSHFIAEKITHGATYLAGLKSILETEAQRTQIDDACKNYFPLINDSTYFVISLLPHRQSSQ